MTFINKHLDSGRWKKDGPLPSIRLMAQTAGISKSTMARALNELIRQKVMARSAEERFMMGVRMFDAARVMALASLPAALSPEELKRQLFQRIYGQSLPS